MARAAGRIGFGRLSDAPPAEILAHLRDPRLRPHMPLLTGAWDLAAVRDFVAAKEAAWARDGLGHWAILRDGRYAGWGGFERLEDEWDFGLALRPEDWGIGPAAARLALDFARADPRIAYVTFLLPPSRARRGALARLGARPAGAALLGGARFLKYRLETG